MSDASQEAEKAFELADLEKSTPPAVRAAALVARDVFASDEARIRAAAKLGSGLGASVTTDTAQYLLSTALAHESYAEFIKTPPPQTPIEAYAAQVNEQKRREGGFGLKSLNTGGLAAIPGTPAGMPPDPAAAPAAAPPAPSSLEEYAAGVRAYREQNKGLGLHRVEPASPASANQTAAKPIPAGARPDIISNGFGLGRS
jgi:hypothetical protein